MELRIAGTTDQKVYVYITEDVGGTNPGEPKAGLTHSNITSIYYTREGGTATTIGTLSTLAAANSAHSDGGFKEVDGTNAKGLYRIDPPDAAFATGSAVVTFTVIVAGASNAVCSPLKVGLIDVNLRDSVRAGLTALPNAAADAAGGLPISDAGGLDLDGRLDADVSSRMATFTLPTNFSSLGIESDGDLTKVNALDGHTPQTADHTSSIATAQTDLDTLTGSDGVTLATAQGNYAPAKAGDAMALTSGERTTLAAVIWDSLTSGMTQAGSLGKKLADWTIHSAADVWSVATRVLTAGTNLNDPTAAAISDAVWGEAIADHSGTSGSTAEALNAAGASGDPWTTALPGAYGAGSAGNIVGNLNDLSAAEVNAEVDTALSDYDPPTKTEMDSGFSGLNDLSAAQVNAEVDTALSDYDGPTKAEMDALIGSPAGADVSADIAAIKSDTAATLTDTGTTLPATLSTIEGKVDTVDGVADAILVDTGTTIPATLGSPAGADMSADIAAIPTAAAIAAAILAAGDVDGYSVEESLRGCLAGLAGKLSGAGTATVTIRAADDSKDRITATVDLNGNRSSVTLDLSA